MRTLALICLLPAAAFVRPAAAQPTAWAHLDSAKHLLSPEAYPALPVAVRRDLTRRGCRVPQASGPDVDPASQRRPNNVVSGAFTAAKSRDWAVLCSIDGVSRILVYAQGRREPIGSLEPAPDSMYLYRELRYDWSYYRVLGVATARFIRSAAREFDGPAPPSRLDHVGIDIAWAGRGSTVYYYYRGRWLELQGMN